MKRTGKIEIIEMPPIPSTYPLRFIRLLKLKVNEHYFRVLSYRVLKNGNVRLRVLRIKRFCKNGTEIYYK